MFLLNDLKPEEVHLSIKLVLDQRETFQDAVNCVEKRSIVMIESERREHKGVTMMLNRLFFKGVHTAMTISNELTRWQYSHGSFSLPMSKYKEFAEICYTLMWNEETQESIYSLKTFSL